MAPFTPAARRDARLVGLSVVTALLALQVLDVVVARADNGDTTIDGCYDIASGALRLPTAEAPDCDPETEYSLSWNQRQPSSRWYRDADGDAYGDWYASFDSPAAPPGYVDNNEDCDDNRAGVNVDQELDEGPGDRDCDGLAAEDRKVRVYVDRDRDGYGAALVEGSMPYSDVPVGYSTVNGDCNDRSVVLGAYECGRDDKDGDGHRAVQAGGDDCADTDPRRYPGRAEVADGFGHDEDCDLATGFVLGRDRLGHDPRPHVVPFLTQQARNHRGRLVGGQTSETLWTAGLTTNPRGAIEAWSTPPGGGRS